MSFKPERNIRFVKGDLRYSIVQGFSGNCAQECFPWAQKTFKISGLKVAMWRCRGLRLPISPGMYVCMYVFMCVCICVCRRVCVGGLEPVLGKHLLYYSSIRKLINKYWQGKHARN